LAQYLMERGKPWRFRITNTTHNHDKFWEAQGTGKYDDVEVRWGRRGSVGTTIVKNWPYVSAEVPKKLGRGYKLSSQTSEVEYHAWYAKTFLPALEFPYSLITCYRPVGENFDCFDAEGIRIATVTPNGVKQLQLEDRPTITLQGAGS